MRNEYHSEVMRKQEAAGSRSLAGDRLGAAPLVVGTEEQKERMLRHHCFSLAMDFHRMLIGQQLVKDDDVIKTANKFMDYLR